MGCRIGITTNEEERKAYWKRQYPNLHSWTILECHNSKKGAQEAEIRLANQHGCEYGVGGDGPDYAAWVVYKFFF